MGSVLTAPTRLATIFVGHSGSEAGFASKNLPKTGESPRHIGHGEGATLAGVALLAGCAVPALLALMPLFHRRRDWPYLALCVAQVAVLLLAASGWISTGH